MATETLSPTPIFKGWDSNGVALINGQLFTYQAGTTTKLNAFLDSVGTPAANPIRLNGRGETPLWIPPNVGYKYVLAPATDTDPPTNPLWTVDNVVNAQLLTLYGGVSGGVVNAYTLTFNAQFTSYTDGIAIYWIPNITNTGPSTININGIGVANIVNQDLSALSAGELIANQVSFILCKGGQFLLSSIVGAGGILTVAGVNVTGGTIPANGMYLAGLNALGFSSNSTFRLIISSAGAIVTAAPTSGVGLTVNGFSGTHSTQIADSGTTLRNAGFLELPPNVHNANYTAVLSDSGQSFYHTDGVAYTWTIPSNAAVPYPLGTTLTFTNDSSGAFAITIAINADTLVLSPSGATGSRTLGQFGRATAHKVAATRWYISGSNLT